MPIDRRAFLALGAALVTARAVAQPSPFARETIDTAFVEDGAPVRLVLLIRKPPGPGPFPTMVFNHGSTGRGDDPALFERSWASAAVADHFTARGWMVVFPQRRGRGGSGGRYDEGFEPDRSRYSCDPGRSLPGVDRAIEDLGAVMAHLRMRADVVQDRILLAGQSRGGILSIAFAGERPHDFIGVVNFVGGWISDRCSNAIRINQSTFRRGARFARPTLWLYGESDPFYSLSHSRANFDDFVAAGGRGRFESYAVPGRDAGHAVIAVPRLWADAVDRYLEEVVATR